MILVVGDAQCVSLAFVTKGIAQTSYIYHARGLDDAALYICWMAEDYGSEGCYFSLKNTLLLALAFLSFCIRR